MLLGYEIFHDNAFLEGEVTPPKEKSNTDSLTNKTSNKLSFLIGPGKINLQGLNSVITIPTKGSTPLDSR